MNPSAYMTTSREFQVHMAKDSGGWPNKEILTAQNNVFFFITDNSYPALQNCISIVYECFVKLKWYHINGL